MSTATVAAADDTDMSAADDDRETPLELPPFSRRSVAEPPADPIPPAPPDARVAGELRPEDTADDGGSSELDVSCWWGWLGSRGGSAADGGGVAEDGAGPAAAAAAAGEATAGREEAEEEPPGRASSCAVSKATCALSEVICVLVLAFRSSSARCNCSACGGQGAAHEVGGGSGSGHERSATRTAVLIRLDAGATRRKSPGAKRAETVLPPVAPSARGALPPLSRSRRRRGPCSGRRRLRRGAPSAAEAEANAQSEERDTGRNVVA